ncbi:MAG: hypothetical protein AAGU27_01760 [Dehalobacterium sp.]
MTGGYMGKMLLIDLAIKRNEEIILNKRLCREYLGGYGLSAKILYK